MSQAETPYTETEFLLRVLNDDEEGGKKLMSDMSDRELDDLRKAFRTGKYWIEDAQSIRFANARDAATTSGTTPDSGAAEESP